MQRRDGGFPGSRCPVRGHSQIAASMASRRGWPAFSHLAPFPFPQVKVRNDGRRPVNRISGHASLTIGDAWIIVGQFTPDQG